MRTVQTYAVLALVALVLGVVAGSILLHSGAEDSKTLPRYSEKAFGDTSATEGSGRKTADKDGDGLADWEEILHGTDPENFDTDGDGMGDGAEVRAGRDPRIPGPNDRILENVFSVLEERRSTNTSPLSFTAPNAAIAPAPQTPTVGGSGVQSPPKNGEVLRAFGNALGLSLAGITTKSFGDEAERLMRNTIGAPDAESLTALAVLATAYRDAAGALAGITAPPEGATLLAALVEGAQMLANALEELATGETAPEVVGTRWMAYSDAAIALGRALNDTIVFFLERRIPFGADEPGSVFSVSL